MKHVKHAPSIACLLLGVLSGTARADDPTPPPTAPTTPEAAAQAKAHADAGTRLYDAQQYEKAAEEYQQAYLLDPVPGYLWASGQALRLGGDCVKALRAYRAFLRTKPADETKVNTNIERCEQYLKDHPPPPEPGTQTTTTPAAPAQPTVIIKTVQAPQRPMVSRPWTGDVAGHVLVGSGVAVAATGVVLFLGGRKTIQDNNNATSYDQFAAGRPDLDAAHTKQTIGISAIAVGGSLVLAGVVHYFIHTRPIPEQSVTVSVTPGQTTVGFALAF